MLDNRHSDKDKYNNEQVISPQAAFLITDILSDQTARIPAFGENSALDLPFAAAVKTGTTTDWRDNWTVGYSTERIAGVWVGNADNEPMLDVSGIDGAGPIWRDIMLQAHRTTPHPFPVPDGIISVEVCAPSGLLPSPHCPYRRLERFIKGTEPTEIDNQFRVETVDIRTEETASAATPVEFRQERVRWILPLAFQDWGLAHGIEVLESKPLAVKSISSIEIDSESNGDKNRPQLTLPISHTAYQIHPSLPSASQRLQVSGRTVDASAWHRLRLVVDGNVIAEKENAQVIDAWWTLETGAHYFHIEGMKTASDAMMKSEETFIEVTDYDVDRQAKLSVESVDAQY